MLIRIKKKKKKERRHYLPDDNGGVLVRVFVQYFVCDNFPQKKKKKSYTLAEFNILYKSH